MPLAAVAYLCCHSVDGRPRVAKCEIRSGALNVLKNVAMIETKYSEPHVEPLRQRCHVPLSLSNSRVRATLPPLAGITVRSCFALKQRLDRYAGPATLSGLTASSRQTIPLERAKSATHFLCMQDVHGREESAGS